MSPNAARLRPVLFELWLPRGPELSWQVLSLRGSEALSRPYEFELELWSEDPDSDLEQVLGADCELLLDRGGLTRTIYGLIAEVEILFAGELRMERAGIGARVKMVPALRLLEHEVDTRFFAGHSAIEILEQLLGSRLAAYGRKLDAQTRIEAEYNRRDYCVQFRESTFAFCQRIMEEEGIAYFFVHDDEDQRERMVLVDNNEDYAAVELLVPEPIPIELDRPEELDRESLQAFHWRRRRATNRVLTLGYNYKTPTQLDEGEAAELDAPHPVVRERVHVAAQRQIVDDPHSDPEATHFDGSGLAQQAPLARRLLEAHRVDAALGRGQSNVVGFAAGVVFELDRAPSQAPRTTEFLLVGVEHEGRLGEGPEGTGSTYSNHFECIDRRQVYRPPLTASKPRVHGVLTGVVVGKAGDEVTTDPLGRVRVAFHMHRHAPPDEGASCWIRVAQIWAGPGYGAMVIPRVGMEVVVSFVDGNPDRPLVTGCVYSGTNTPPYELPAELSKSTFKTSSSPGGEGHSELRLEDAQGREQVFVRAQRRMDLRVQGRLFATCTGGREERVGTEKGEPVTHAVTLHGELNSMVHEDRLSHVMGLATATCNQDVLEANLGRRLVWADELHQVSAPTIVAEASDTISHKAKLVSLSGSDTVSVMAGARLVLESNNAIELRVGQSFISLAPEGVDIQGVTLRLNSGGGVGHAKEALAAERFEAPIPFEALPADDGRPGGGGGGGGGGGREREHRSWKLEPHTAPPMKPPPPRLPGDATVLPDGRVRRWVSVAWRQSETWCSDEVILCSEAHNYPPEQLESVLIQNASDGAVASVVAVTPGDGALEHSIVISDILPRRLAEGVEEARQLVGRASAGPLTPTPLTLRFITNLPRVHYDEDRARFDLEIRDHQVEIGGTIPYKLGMMARIISLGDLAPDHAGGLIGQKVYGSRDYRYCKDLWKGGESHLVYWDGKDWVRVPSAFKNPFGTKLHGMSVWKEDGVVKTQYGTLPWPDDVPEWHEFDRTTLLEKRKGEWVAAINEFWSRPLDIKRDQCRGHDPKCCRFRVVCRVSFVERDRKTAEVVVIGENKTRANSRAWSLMDSERTVIHEFGHHLGNPDEYRGATSVDWTVNGDGALLGIDKKSIMGSGRKIRRRHFNTVCEALAQLVERETGRSCTFSAHEALP